MQRIHRGKLYNETSRSFRLALSSIKGKHTPNQPLKYIQLEIFGNDDNKWKPDSGRN
jgi:hypothetical protein